MTAQTWLLNFLKSSSKPMTHRMQENIMEVHPIKSFLQVVYNIDFCICHLYILESSTLLLRSPWGTVQVNGWATNYLYNSMYDFASVTHIQKIFSKDFSNHILQSFLLRTNYMLTFFYFKNIISPVNRCAMLVALHSMVNK